MSGPHLTAFILAFAYFTFVVGLAEWLRRRRGVAPDITRALVQIGAAFWILPAGQLFDEALGVALSYLAFAIFLVLSFRLEIFASVEDDGASLGPTLWPVSCALLSVWFTGERAVLAATAILGAGLGDTAAGLVGRRLGTRKFRALGNRRTMEGTLAMFLTAGVTMAPVLVGLGGLDWHQAVAFSLIGATVAASVEAVSIGRADNLIVPLATGAILAMLMRFSQ